MLQRRGSGRHDGSADIVVRGPVLRGGGTRTRRHNVHARTEEVGLLDGPNRLHCLKLLGRLKRDDRFYLLSRLERDNRFYWLRSGGGEAWARGGGRGDLELVEVVICQGYISLNPNGSRKGNHAFKGSGRFGRLRWGQSRCVDQGRGNRPATKTSIIGKAKQVDLLNTWFLWCLC